jgi:hypothetical protein
MSVALFALLLVASCVAAAEEKRDVVPAQKGLPSEYQREEKKPSRKRKKTIFCLFFSFSLCFFRFCWRCAAAVVGEATVAAKMVDGMRNRAKEGECVFAI